jgi:hypothetical protein
MFCKAWSSLSTLLDNREQVQEFIALQMHIPYQELANIQIKVKHDGERMSSLYDNFRQAAKKIQEEAQQKTDNTEQERKAAE